MIYPIDSIHEVNGEVYAIYSIAEDTFKTVHLFSSKPYQGLTSFYENLIMMGINPYEEPSERMMDYMLELLSEITFGR